MFLGDTTLKVTSTLVALAYLTGCASSSGKLRPVDIYEMEPGETVVVDLRHGRRAEQYAVPPTTPVAEPVPSGTSSMATGTVTRVYATRSGPALSSSIVGIFVGAERDTSEYAERYAAWVETHSLKASLPEIGGRLSMVLSDGRRVEGEFIGFDRIDWAGEWVIGVWTSVDQAVAAFPLEQVTRLGQEGMDLGSLGMGEWYQSDQLPVLTTIRLRDPGGEYRIPLSDVAMAQMGPVFSSGMVAIGFVWLAAIIYVITQVDSLGPDFDFGGDEN